MKDHEIVTHKGKVVEVFAHRFVLQTATGRVLADLTPKGADRIRLREGDELEITGERKPSEVKVRRVVKGNGKPVEIEHKPPPGPGRPHPGSAEAVPEKALRGARSSGVTVLGRPRRRPKHFEILGRDESGELVELHVEFDGHIRKSRRVDPEDPKWEGEIRDAESHGDAPA